jgi:hypothetical protein
VYRVEDLRLLREIGLPIGVVERLHRSVRADCKYARAQAEARARHHRCVVQVRSPQLLR